jgi:hypothetical protein
MQSSEATKTYMALCDGDGKWNGVDYLKKGWFSLDLPVKNEWGKSEVYDFLKRQNTTNS